LSGVTAFLCYPIGLTVALYTRAETCCSKTL